MAASFTTIPSVRWLRRLQNPWRSLSHGLVLLLSAGVLFLSIQAKQSMYVVQSNPTWHLQKSTKMRTSVEPAAQKGIAQSITSRYLGETQKPPRLLFPRWRAALPKFVLLAPAPDHPRSPPALQL